MTIGPDDPMAQFVQRLNRDAKVPVPIGGQIPLLDALGEKPRPSGWKCPKCGTEADQAANPVNNPLDGSLIGAKWLTDESGRPLPIAIIANEVTGESNGKPTLYTTHHCMNCFNRWQRRKMMEDIRANVPQLEYKGL